MIQCFTTAAERAAYRLHPRSKLASWTGHIGDFWEQLKDLASRNKVERDQRFLSLSVNTHTQTHTASHMQHAYPHALAHIHTWGKRKGTVKKIQVCTTIFLWKKLCIYTSIKFSCLHPKIDNLPRWDFINLLIFLTDSFYLFWSWDMKFMRHMIILWIIIRTFF